MHYVLNKENQMQIVHNSAMSTYIQWCNAISVYSAATVHLPL